MGWFSRKRSSAGSAAPSQQAGPLPRADTTSTGIVVEVIDGGCGGVRRDQHAYPSATSAQVSAMGELVLLGDDGRPIERFAGGTWVNWRPGNDPGPSRSGSC